MNQIARNLSNASKNGFGVWGQGVGAPELKQIKPTLEAPPQLQMGFVLLLGPIISKEMAGVYHFLVDI